MSVNPVEIAENVDVLVEFPFNKLRNDLDPLGQRLATDIPLRTQIGDNPTTWPELRSYWRALVGYLETPGEVVWEDVVSLARYTRNLVAAVPRNQQEAFGCEPDIRKALFLATSFANVERAESFAAVRMMVQAISNVITENDALSGELWDAYMALPEERLILLRLLTHPDPKTQMSTMVLILNCVNESDARLSKLHSTPSGVRVCISLLDRIAQAADLTEAVDASRIFDIGYAIFAGLFACGGFAPLLARCTVADEPVSPHQATLLKLLDAHLQMPALARAHALPTCTALAAALLTLSSDAQRAIGRALGPTGGARATGEGEELREVDLALPAICAALVLLAQCLTAITLAFEDYDSFPEENPRQLLEDATADDGTPLIESLIHLLAALDRFLPKLQFGRPVPSPASASTEQQQQQHPGSAGFAYLKRDLVRLLGVLSHARRSVQDRVRACGGIPVVMNLCVVDERNPYLREHALFALRNLLQGNPENQAVVDGIKPSASWDEEGLLKETPGAVRR